jgi:hypothetical protein
MTMVLRLLTASALAAALGPAAATAAVQPTIAPLAPCYVAAQPDQTQPIGISASGFAPLATLDVYVDNVLQTPPTGTPQAQADPAGNFTGTVPAPYIPLGVHRFALRIAEAANPSATASSIGWVTALTVEQIPAQARTRARVRFKGRGFTQPGPIYAHYVYKGHSHKTVRVVRRHGACGAFSRKMRQFPFHHSPKVGTWTIQFYPLGNLTPTPDVSARLTVKVNRAIHGRRR